VSRQRRLQWGLPEPETPKRPYRDTLLVYASLAVVIVVVAVLTGGSARVAIEVAAGFFVVSSAYGMVQWRRKLRRAEAERRRADGLP
jgi:hypothetical protein